MYKPQEVLKSLDWPDKGAFLESGVGFGGMTLAGKLVEHGHDIPGVALAIFSGAVALHGVYRYGNPDTTPLESEPEEAQQA